MSGKNKKSEDKPGKVKAAKKYTRMQAEKVLRVGMDPELLQTLSKHANYHVRRRAWVLMGRVYPKDAEECAKLCVSLHMKDPNATVESVKTDE